MIDEIQVHDLALIHEARLEPSRSLTVLTGETGAGKTALLSALKLLMGARASSELVRDGEEELVVAGRFFGLTATRDDDGADSARPRPVPDADFAEDETVVSRKVNVEGRSRASVDGSMASARELAELVAPSIDLCGQFEHQQLMRPATHVLLLDAWAGEAVAQAKAAYADAFSAAVRAAEELQRVREARQLTSAKLDEARFTLRRIDEVSPKEGEYDQLKHDLSRAENAEALASAASLAHEALSGEEGALDSLNAAASALEAASAADAELGALAASLREAGFVLEDVAAQARDYRDKVEFDPDELAFQQERFSLLQGLLRSFGPRMEDVFERRAEAADAVSLADDASGRLEAAELAHDQAQRELALAADALDAARADAAPGFAREVTAVMGRLQMGTAELVCELSRLPREEWTRSGPSSFEFLYRATSGTHPRPLARIASGGEVSRVMLAIKVVLGGRDGVDTLVFDEVDAGVGGAVAVSLAEVIADLAQSHQVLVVTHLAQVAVRADVHYLVTREGGETHLRRVEGADREAEIARMLSGSITDASLAHARELLGKTP